MIRVRAEEAYKLTFEYRLLEEDGGVGLGKKKTAVSGRDPQPQELDICEVRRDDSLLYLAMSVWKCSEEEALVHNLTDEKKEEKAAAELAEILAHDDLEQARQELKHCTSMLTDTKSRNVLRKNARRSKRCSQR